MLTAQSFNSATLLGDFSDVSGERLSFVEAENALNRTYYHQNPGLLTLPLDATLSYYHQSAPQCNRSLPGEAYEDLANYLLVQRHQSHLYPPQNIESFHCTQSSLSNGPIDQNIAVNMGCRLTELRPVNCATKNTAAHQNQFAKIYSSSTTDSLLTSNGIQPLNTVVLMVPEPLQAVITIPTADADFFRIERVPNSKNSADVMLENQGEDEIDWNEIAAPSDDNMDRFLASSKTVWTDFKTLERECRYYVKHFMATDPEFPLREL